nr:MAG TPA: acetyltransferase domain containing protein [Caudoviricetes sp.]
MAAFSASLPFAHPKKKNTWKEHRLVVLPDFQGIGIGTTLSNWVAEYFSKQGKSYITTTSNPARIHGLKNSKLWRCTHIGRCSKGSRTGIIQNRFAGVHNSSSYNRITASFEYIKNK